MVHAAIAFPTSKDTIMTKHIAILPGDGIGPEIIAQAVRVLDCLIENPKR